MGVVNVGDPLINIGWYNFGIFCICFPGFFFLVLFAFFSILNYDCKMYVRESESIRRKLHNRNKKAKPSACQISLSTQACVSVKFARSSICANEGVFFITRPQRHNTNACCRQ